MNSTRSSVADGETIPPVAKSVIIIVLSLALAVCFICIIIWWIRRIRIRAVVPTNTIQLVDENELRRRHLDVLSAYGLA
jgi:flagellar biogenesis protein FliO